MEITLQRNPSKGGFTLGKLSVNEQFLCYTAEDVIREKRGVPVAQWKVAGQTAIPSGRYKVVVSMSNRFKRPLPELLNVPGYTGVRIHPGNTAADTEGCILPGVGAYSAGVTQSRAAFGALFKRIQEAIAVGEDVHITIKNP
jgi:hypothetical protein